MAKAARGFAVIGLGRFGSQVARDLSRFGNHVIGIDSDERLVTAVADALSEAVIADATDERALREAGVGGCAAAILAIGSNLEVSVLAFMNLKTIGVEDITVKAFDQKHERILRELGAQSIILPEHDAGAFTAERLNNPLILNFVRADDENHVGLVEAPADRCGERYAELTLPDDADLALLGIIRSGRLLTIGDHNDLFVANGDMLVLHGPMAGIRAFAGGAG
ncbi:MAG: TrkA family potassium uptake protein [Pacificimonas sp.]|jgi:trk system potassium uptake protein TrkA|nr:TrkA family potassium uptake protein [Pacificimonas sp.]